MKNHNKGDKISVDIVTPDNIPFAWQDGYSSILFFYIKYRIIPTH